jgi:hypothetical protein
MNPMHKRSCAIRSSGLALRALSGKVITRHGARAKGAPILRAQTRPQALGKSSVGEISRKAHERFHEIGPKILASLTQNRPKVAQDRSRASANS